MPEQLLTPLSSYTWFFYLGIILFVTHIFLYGFGIDMSFLGLLLIYIGWAKPVIYEWFRKVLWVLLVLEFIANGRVAYDRFMGIKEEDDIPTKKVYKEGNVDKEDNDEDNEEDSGDKDKEEDKKGGKGKGKGKEKENKKETEKKKTD